MSKSTKCSLQDFLLNIYVLNLGGLFVRVGKLIQHPLIVQHFGKYISKKSNDHYKKYTFLIIWSQLHYFLPKTGARVRYNMILKVDDKYQNQTMKS